MRRPTIQIPLLRQPPVYMILAVVLVSLVPLGLQLFGARPLAPQPSELLPLTAQAGLTEVSLQALRPSCNEPAVGSTESLAPPAPTEQPTPDLDEVPPLEAIAMALDRAEPEEDVEVLIIEDEAEPAAQPRKRSRGLLTRSRRATKKRSPTAANMVRATTACRRGNKGVARSAYRDLPRGDARKQVRRDCREHDILLL